MKQIVLFVTVQCDDHICIVSKRPCHDKDERVLVKETEEGGSRKGWRGNFCWGWMLTLELCFLMRLISSMSVKASAASRFSMRIWTHVCACACVHIQTLKRRAAEALDGMKQARRTKRHYANITMQSQYKVCLYSILHPRSSVDTPLLMPILNMARAFRYCTAKNRTLC